MIPVSTVSLNGIFYVHAQEQGFKNSEAVSTFLNNINVAAIASIAGPYSVVLVMIGSQVYWYRGVKYGNLLTHTPAFGTDVTDLLHPLKLVSRIEEIKKSLEIPIVYHKNSMLVFWKGKMLDLPSLNEQLSRLTVDEIVERILEMNDVLTQLQVILNPEQLEKVIAQLIKTLTELTEKNDELSDLNSKIKELFEKKDFTELKILSSKIKTIKNKLNKTISPLIQKIGQLISLQKSSKRVFSLKQIQR